MCRPHRLQALPATHRTHSRPRPLCRKRRCLHAGGGSMTIHDSTRWSNEPPRWWRLYDDPRLDALVERALAANTDLRVAAANLERARAITREVRAVSDEIGRAHV